MDRLSSLYGLLDFLATVRESNDFKIWSRLLEKTAAAVGAEAGAYYFYDTLAGRLVLFHSIGGRAAKEEARTVALGSGVAGWTAKYHEPVLASDLSAEKRYAAAADALPGVEPRSLLSLPLFISLDFVGVWQFLDPAAGRFGAEDLRLAQTAAAQASYAIRRLRLEEMVGRVTSYNASILDNMSGGFLAVDLQGRVMICNPAARRILGIQGEVTDMAVEKALFPVPALAEVLRRTLSSKQTLKRQELSFERAGQARLLGYSTLLIQDAQGAMSGAGITFQDITKPSR